MASNRWFRAIREWRAEEEEASRHAQARLSLMRSSVASRQ